MVPDGLATQETNASATVAEYSGFIPMFCVLYLCWLKFWQHSSQLQPEFLILSTKSDYKIWYMLETAFHCWKFMSTKIGVNHLNFLTAIKIRMYDMPARCLS